MTDLGIGEIGMPRNHRIRICVISCRVRPDPLLAADPPIEPTPRIPLWRRFRPTLATESSVQPKTTANFRPRCIKVAVTRTEPDFVLRCPQFKAA